MEMQTSKSPHPLIWIAAIAVILLCGTGVAAIMGWIPSSMGTNNNGEPISNTDSASGNNSKAPAKIAHAAPAKAACSYCGVIESTREVSTKGKGSGLGIVGGAVVGGLLGNQIGDGHGREAATVVGAVGGGVAGNEIERRVKTTKRYEVTVRMNDGSHRVVTQETAANWHAGDRVKIVDGAIRSN